MSTETESLKSSAEAIRASYRTHWLTGCGGIFATTIRVLLNQSFWWGVLLFFGWLYVIYAFTVRHESTVAGIRRLLDFFK